MKILFVSFIVTLSLLADDIYYRQGHVYRNVQVVDTIETHIRFKTVEGVIRTVVIGAVDRIDFMPIDPAYESRIIMYKENPGLEPNAKPFLPKRQPLKNFVKSEYPKINFLFVSAIALGLSWDYFSQASDLQQSIDGFKQLSIPTDKLESQKLRKTLLGVVFLATGVATTIIAFEKVEIKATTNTLSLSYNF
ncbi:MAG: hypothetical protein HYV29_01615 [Ignavibacteriales bacterium]|nr:hypothetical protein [Ignavibacteriales bacterium]